MNKVGISTLHINNYGSILQCYASMQYLDRNGFECHLIDEKADSRKFTLTNLKKLMRLVHDSICYRNYLNDWIIMKKSMAHDRKLISNETYRRMNLFVEEHLKPELFTWNELKALGEDENYIAFIVGSDQVWNLSRKLNPLFFLQFAPMKKRITLSVSCGVSTVPDFNRKDFKKGLEGFNKVSVREDTIISPILDLTGKKAIRLPDPTFIFDKQEWLDLLGIKDNPQEYYLVHFLNKPSEIAIEFINRYNQGCNPVYCIGYNYEEFKRINNYCFIDGGPEEYISYINSAKAVFTDSFHSTIFSINFQKEFYCFERNYSHGFPQSSRILDLLNRFSLSDRFVTDVDQKIGDLDTEIINGKIMEERFLIRQYIDDELKSRV